MMLKLSLWLYRYCLYLYPADFRREYGDLMQLVFEEACHDARSGIGAWLRLWRITLNDLIRSVYSEHRTKNMKQKIHDYEINAVLGEGAAASVYRAYDSELAMQVALKVFNETSETEFLANFEREGTIHTALDHPNIPRCFGFVNADNKKYIVLQYINGKTLLELQQERNKPFTPQQVIGWGSLACDVLTYLHSNDYVYRDMKPGNLMLSAEGQLYVIDYGITVAGEGDGVAIGTIGYSPPEQYKGEVTSRSDIYALGASLHQLLTNRDARFHDAHTFHDAPPTMYNPDVSPALEAVILKALSDDPAGRYPTADDFKKALLASNGTHTSRRDVIA